MNWKQVFAHPQVRTSCAAMLVTWAVSFGFSAATANTIVSVVLGVVWTIDTVLIGKSSATWSAMAKDVLSDLHFWTSLADFGLVLSVTLFHADQAKANAFVNSLTVFITIIDGVAANSEKPDASPQTPKPNP